MTTKTQVKANVSTHFPNDQDVKVEQQGDEALNNSQDGMMLLDPEDTGDGCVTTHSEKEPEFKGPATVPVRAKKVHAADAGSAQPLAEPPPVKPGSVNIPNDEDPAAGILKTDGTADSTDDLPIIENASVDDEHDDFAEDELMLAADGDDEFDDLADQDEDDEFSAVELEGDLGLGDEADTMDDAGADMDMTADFENVEITDDEAPLVDVDGIDDASTGEELVFASVGKALHVIRSNRIIASMGPKAAAKAGFADVYQMDRFQDVVQASVEKKGLRKGLVQHGFVMATVKLTANKAQAKVVKAKVEKEVTARLETLAGRDAVMEQSLAIAATGINKQFFRDVPNELKAHLITELEHAGVRNASRIVRAAFSDHGTSYAKSILTLAKKISAMPDEVRDNYVTALDMTDGGADLEVEDELPISDNDVDVEDDFIEEEVPVVASRSLKAALAQPLQRDRSTAALLRASNGGAAYEILSGNKSLV